MTEATTTLTRAGTEPATPHILTLYAVRMWADELFRDLKSQGFHLEQTRLTHPERLDRLMLALALALAGLLLATWPGRAGPPPPPP